MHETHMVNVMHVMHADVSAPDAAVEAPAGELPAVDVAVPNASVEGSAPAMPEVGMTPLEATLPQVDLAADKAAEAPAADVPLALATPAVPPVPAAEVTLSEDAPALPPVTVATGAPAAPALDAAALTEGPALDLTDLPAESPAVDATLPSP
jgi:hypothetical protein